MFTAEEAFNASQDGDPILMTFKAACALCVEHGAHLDEYHTEMCANFNPDQADDWLTARGETGYDAGHLLGWLVGY